MAGTGLLAGVGGMATCCSPLALVVVGALGSAAPFVLADAGLWLAGGLLGGALAWQAHRMGRAAAPCRPAAAAGSATVGAEPSRGGSG